MVAWFSNLVVLDTTNKAYHFLEFGKAKRKAEKQAEKDSVVCCIHWAARLYLKMFWLLMAGAATEAS